MGVCRDMKNCSMYAGVQCTQVFNLTGSTALRSALGKDLFDFRLIEFVSRTQDNQLLDSLLVKGDFGIHKQGSYMISV